MKGNQSQGKAFSQNEKKRPGQIQDGSYSYQQNKKDNDGSKIGMGQALVDQTNAKEFDGKNMEESDQRINDESERIKNRGRGQIRSINELIEVSNSSVENMKTSRSQEDINFMKQPDYQNDDQMGQMYLKNTMQNDQATVENRSLQLFSVDASKSQTAVISDVNVNIQSPTQEIPIMKNNQKVMNQQLFQHPKIQQKKQLLKKNFHQEQDQNINGDSLQSASANINQNIKQVQDQNANGVFVENSQLENDNQDANNVNQKQLLDNQNSLFNQSLPMQFEDEAGPNPAASNKVINKKQQNYAQLPSNSFELSIEVGQPAQQQR